MMDITDNTPTEDIIEHLTKLCKFHDWFFTMSDDSNAYHKGLADSWMIDRLKKVLVARDKAAEADEIISKFKPSIEIRH